MVKMTEKERVITTNQHGQRRVVVEWQRWTEFRALDGPKQRLPAGTEFLTDDGLDVNKNDDGTYTVIQTDEILSPRSNGG